MLINATLPDDILLHDHDRHREHKEREIELVDREVSQEIRLAYASEHREYDQEICSPLDTDDHDRCKCRQHKWCEQHCEITEQPNAEDQITNGFQALSSLHPTVLLPPPRFECS